MASLSLRGTTDPVRLVATDVMKGSGPPTTSVSLQAFVAIGDYNGHVGLGVKCSKEVATAIRGAIILAKLSIVPVRRGYWGNKIGKPHTVPCKVGWMVVRGRACSGADSPAHLLTLPLPR